MLGVDLTAHRPLEPFSVDHFRRYCGFMVLDNGARWELEAFQLDVAAEIFAGTAEVWLDVPEGNGKTTLLAGFALHHADHTPAASVPMAASSRDQTGVLLGQAGGFVDRTPGLADRFKVLPGHRRINALRTNGRIQVYAADDRTGDGIIPTLALLEELHRHPSLQLYRTWRGKLDKRGGQLVAISTAGEPAGEYENAKAAALKVADVSRDGARTVARTPHFVMHQYALKLGDDLHDLEIVKQANPFTGVTAESLKRKHDSPTMLESHWARFVCGVPTRGDRSAISPEEWSNLPRSPVPPNVPVWVGADFGWKWDTTAIVPLWMPDLERRVLGVPTIIVPPRDGTATAPEEIRAAFRAVAERNPIHTVVLDENAGGHQMSEWLSDPAEGIGARVLPYSQANVAQALAFERFMEALREGWLEHPHDLTLTSHVLNAVAKPVLNDRFRFDRPRHVRQARGQEMRVIDALVAAAMVHAAAIADHSAVEEPAMNVSDFRIVPL